MEATLREIQTWAEHRNPLWGFDFDGTLVGHSEKPQIVSLGSESLKLLAAFADRHEIAIISGRSMNDLKRLFPRHLIITKKVSLVANHGAEILPYNGSLWLWNSRQWQDWRSAELAGLKRFVEERGADLEDKGLSIAIHFRRSSEKEWWFKEGEHALHSWVRGKALIMTGALSLNLTPIGAPDKGDAVGKLCGQTGHDSVIYFGDEPTDENVFRLKQPPIFGVKVGPGPSLAPFRLEGPNQVLALLAQFV